MKHGESTTIRIMVLSILVLVMSFASDSFVRKAIKAIMRPYTTISWEEVKITEERVLIPQNYPPKSTTGDCPTYR